MSSDKPGESIVEISGDMVGGIPAIAAIAKQIQPQMGGQPGVAGQQSVPVDLNSLTGDLSVRLLATTFLDSQATITKQNFSINGSVQDFGTMAPIQGHKLSNGQRSDRNGADAVGRRSTGMAGNATDVDRHPVAAGRAEGNLGCGTAVEIECQLWLTQQV